MSFQLGSELLSAVLGTAVGYGIKYGYDEITRVWVKDRLMRKAWHFLQEGDTYILIPLFDADDIGTACAYGDMLAMSNVVTVANTYFEEAAPPVLRDAEDDFALLESNLVVIGGCRHNTVFRKLVDKLPVPIQCFCDPSEHASQMRHYDGSTVLSATFEDNGRLTHDIGILVRARNPYHPQKWVVLAAGLYTYGTAAAIEYLTSTASLQDVSRHLDQNFEVVLRARVHNHCISNIQPIPPMLTW
jgi:hypothetical protein